jgi:hypothetical protein
VDSRISSREEQVTKTNKYIKHFLNVFKPEELDRTFYKSSKTKTIIDSDAGGLFDYLQATNVKNKVKNLLFLCMRFSQCLTLHYNPKKLSNSWGPEKSIEDRIVLHMQCILDSTQDKQHNGSKISSKNKSKEKAISLEHKTFIITLKYSEYLLLPRQMLEYIEVISDPQIHMVISDSHVPINFIAISKTELFSAYEKLYPDLSNRVVHLSLSNDKMEEEQTERVAADELSRIAEMDSTSSPIASPISPVKHKISPNKASAPILTPFPNSDRSFYTCS